MKKAYKNGAKMLAYLCDNCRERPARRAAIRKYKKSYLCLECFNEEWIKQGKEERCEELTEKEIEVRE